MTTLFADNSDDDFIPGDGEKPTFYMYSIHVSSTRSSSIGSNHIIIGLTTIVLLTSIVEAVLYS